MKTLVLLVASIALLVSLLLLTQKKDHEQHHLEKRWSYDNSHLRDLDKDHNHAWMNNAWYRYVYDRVHAEDNYTDCYVCSHMPTTAIHATIYGKPPTTSEALCIYDKAITGNCSLPGQPVMVIGASMKDQYMDTCQNGTRYIVPQTQKNLIYNFANCTHYYPNFNYTCNERYWELLHHPDSTRLGWRWLIKRHVLGTGCSLGVWPKTYFMLPPNSTGLCAPILFKLWTTGQKVLHSLFPWVGTGKNMLRIETLDYRFGLFLNSSTKINKAQNEEIDAIRIVVMQHRVALDMILAERGGLCVLFNTTCCTYILDNVHSLNMTTALNTLHQLSDVQQQDYVTNTEDWLTWLLSGSWKTLLMKGLVIIGVLLLLLCMFSTCILPCIRSMILNMVNTSIIAYVGIPQEDYESNV
uniref:Envelope glycoprotein n=1 Tax=Haplochromis burtoni TaxID=8153 RepID=A0A3Q2VRQ0_HAPBU